MKRFPRANPEERRISSRYLVELRVQISSKGGVTPGTIKDLSSTGARIEETRLRPAEGAALELEFSLLPGSLPLVLKSDVVRLTSTGGFCVRFLELPARADGLMRTLLPKIGKGRVSGDSEDGTLITGELELKIGTAFHERIAELARSEGLETSDWVRNSLEKSATDSTKPSGPRVIKKSS